VSPVLLPLSDENLMNYIDKALKVQINKSKNGEYNFYFDEFKRKENQLKQKEKLPNYVNTRISNKTKAKIDENDIENPRVKSKDLVGSLENQQASPQGEHKEEFEEVQTKFMEEKKIVDNIKSTSHRSNSIAWEKFEGENSWKIDQHSLEAKKIIENEEILFENDCKFDLKEDDNQNIKDESEIEEDIFGINFHYLIV